MSEEGVEVAEKAVDELRQSFAQGEIVDDEGRRFLTEELVGSFKGLTVRIFGREHPPPHFRVECQGESANFAIETGERLAKNKGLERFDRNIRKWWATNRDLPVTVWNDSRPSDCPVGPIVQKES
jgi:hypothetical protein